MSLNINRQCGIGYHEECSDPNGYECECPCHSLLDRMHEALVWMSGADDFGPEGKARAGFEKIVVPILEELRERSS